MIRMSCYNEHYAVHLLYRIYRMLRRGRTESLVGWAALLWEPLPGAALHREL